MNNEALNQCNKLSLDFPLLFRYQYLITKNSNPTFPMASHTVGNWTVFVGSALPVARLQDLNGHDLGLVLGIAVDPQGLVENDYLVADLDASSSTFFHEFEDWLKYLSGRYTIILHAQHQSRVYADPVGMNGVVYDREAEQVAASTLLCLNRPVIDNTLFDPQVVTEGGKYSLFHTPDAYVHRVNPNAYLDLSDFIEYRFWPRGEVFRAEPEEWPALYDEMSAATKHATKCITAKYTTALPLSGGQDSRLLASMIGDEINNVPQVFTHIPNYASRIDAAVAALIAKELKVPHEIFDKRDSHFKKWRRQKSELEFQTASGVIAPQPQELRLGINLNLADGAVILRGHQTDLLRAVFIRRPGAQGRKNFRWQVKILNIVPPATFDNNVYDRFLPSYQAWYDTLPTPAKEKSIDFAFLEIYYSSTLGVTFPGLYRNFYLSPFNSRRMIELSLSIDDEYRRNSYAVNDIIWRKNPALHDLPFDYEAANHALDALGDEDVVRKLSADRSAQTQERALKMRTATETDLPIKPKA